MKEIIFSLSLIFSFQIAIAQFQDNFDDGSFPNDPNWFGNTNIYTVNTESELQLMDIDEGSSFIYAPVNTADSTTWVFYFRLEFDPSASNRLKVFLSSDSPIFDGDLNGYFLQVGQSGSDDALELWRQDGANATMILSGSMGSVATSPAVRVRITRNDGGLWQLFADYTGGNNFQLDGSINDPTYLMSSYFGFHCSYSATRKDKFYFDDIVIGPLVLDQTPPSLVNVSPINTNSLLLGFTEALDQSSAENITNYTINNGITVNAANQDSDPSKVILSVSNLLSGQNYQLNSFNIEDQSGNLSVNEGFEFIFYEIENPDPYDILINEIFPHPDPNITALPNAEYFELYNRSNKAFDLAGFEIADATSTKMLPSFIFPPNSYVIICDEDDLNSYSNYGTVIGVPGIFKLNDSGDDLSITDTAGTIIHDISYTIDWYHDVEKDNGGWSIEMINPNLYCQGKDNWRASNNLEGGTPGQENSVFNNSPDSSPPSLISAIPTSQNQLRLFFNEIMDLNSENPASYSIPGAGNVIDAMLELPELNTVLLTIDPPYFIDQTAYTVTVDESVTDCSGNDIGANSFFQFKYYDTQEAERYELLFNEIFPDPTPSIGLPEQEFIELYNPSNKAINLEDFIISDGSNEVILPFHLLLPDQYVIIYGSGGSSYSAYGDTLVLTANVSLPNQSGDLELINPQGKTIHAVSYNIDWYQDNDKNDGGWTLELINPEAPCSFGSNWRASLNAIGGTPGMTNSVLEKRSDTEGPDLIKAYPLSSTLLSLDFSEALDEAAGSDPSNYVIEGITVTDAFLQPPFFNRVLLTFGSAMETDRIYNVTVRSELTDCVGNAIGLNNNARFALPQAIETKDIVINEVLFNPETGGQRFVELYNRSNKTFDLSELIIASRNSESNEIEKPEPIQVNCLLFPKDYIVLTASPIDINDRYFVENPYALISTALPTYDDKKGTVVLYVPEILGEKVIDEFEYSEDFHNPLLSNKNGVSLERIDPESTTNDGNNWHSAATSVGYATPTYQNSQFLTVDSSIDEVFSISNNTLSPDGDGYEDFLLINYKTSQSGYLANIQIFDAKGRSIKKLVSNELLATEGTFKWDGDKDDGRKSRIGIYIVWIEYFNPEGNVNYLKKTCVVAGRLN